MSYSQSLFVNSATQHEYVLEKKLFSIIGYFPLFLKVKIKVSQYFYRSNNEFNIVVAEKIMEMAGWIWCLKSMRPYVLQAVKIL